MTVDLQQGDGVGKLQLYLAAERTALAWIRTGLAMMGFGFVVARFGLFLHEIAGLDDVAPNQQHSFSLWVGTILVILGVAVNLLGGVKHWRMIRRLETSQPIRFRPLSLGVIVAMLLALFGLLLACYLHLGLDSGL